jgi:DNA invertase Pin-like site-specific DNA recombinase
MMGRLVMKRAIAYVSDIILGRTGDVIKRGGQVELIAQYATDNGIEIIGWFEDEMYHEEVLERPGIVALLSYDKPYDLVLCERVWALSRSMAVLEPFFRELDRRGVRLEFATTMWDCVSQQCRRRFRSASYAAPQPARPVVEKKNVGQARVARPSHMHFAHLVK